MDALYLLIPIALGVMVVVVIAFIYTVKSGQYDDLEGPAHRILMDDDDPRIPGNQKPPVAEEKDSQRD
ncbi:cbb3-type cytochrome oxidase assembly protein CcoS [Thiothrix litoralis]|jgi:cbb3-type cytochrome oxidase maturation protein|uniref:Cbb3-type cytochrome oxidase assembly protein CcoS n=1 Tax=Thiothrix litoralis TaxID=2891210 RepID=A0ABX7X0Y8_9GAMM|nr:cbb3-type cytochrome oxidase assembly protein CcoS [Thiothrix litoralis]QTR46815.1 cbb3-type cytochrome oxidase assembly protein CcoS [Thiothrix litoralis]